MPHSEVTVHAADGIATLTLDRQDVMNALSDPMIDALLAALDAVCADPAVRVVVIRGVRKAFCAGADLRIIGSNDKRSREQKLAHLRHVYRLPLALIESPKVFGHMKRNLAAAEKLSFAELLDFEALTQVEAVEAADHREAVSAFREKRASRFAGN